MFTYLVALMCKVLLIIQSTTIGLKTQMRRRQGTQQLDAKTMAQKCWSLAGPRRLLKPWALSQTLLVPGNVQIGCFVTCDLWHLYR